jgi:hypothetical protein
MIRKSGNRFSAFAKPASAGKAKDHAPAKNPAESPQAEASRCPIRPLR